MVWSFAAECGPDSSAKDNTVNVQAFGELYQGFNI